MEESASMNPNCKKPNTVMPKEGRCRFYMPRKQRFCTVIVDSQRGIMYCYDHQVLVNEAASKAVSVVGPSPPVHTSSTEGGEKRPRSPAEEPTSAAPIAEDERMPCPYSTLHTIRKKNYWLHLNVCPHKPSPSTVYCTQEDCNIVAPDLRRADRRLAFADVADEVRQSFLTWVAERYDALEVEKSILLLDVSKPLDGLPDFSVAGFVRQALHSYVASGKAKEATQHVALTNIAHLAFFSSQITVESFPRAVTSAAAMRNLAAEDTASKAKPTAEDGASVGIIEYGAGKGGLIAAMRRAYPQLPTIVVDRDLFRDMKDTQLAKEGRGGRRKEAQGQQGNAAEPEAASSTSAPANTPHARIKMNIKDFNVDKCLEGIKNGSVELLAGGTIQCSDQSLLPTQWLAVGKHLCGGCTDMTLRSVVEAKEVAFRGIMIATCCHHMCSPDTYLYPSLFDGAPNLLAKTPNCEAASSSPFEMFLDCCCGIAGWAISGKDIDDDRRLVGRKVKRLLDFGRVQYLKARRRHDGSGPLFRFVGMVQYASNSTTEENEVLVAIP